MRYLFICLLVILLIACLEDKSPVEPINDYKQHTEILDITITERHLEYNKRNQMIKYIEEAVYNYCAEQGISHNDVWVGYTIKVEIQINHQRTEEDS